MHAITACLGISKHVCRCAWRVVVAYYTERQQAIAVVALFMGQIIPVKFSIPVCRVMLEDFDILFVKPCHLTFSSS
ncbi:hypothetical protein A6R73_10150 [Xanthomonas translucens pv. poae]|uniref:Uncharacterized protein n=1 Tax=Xanthomonas graminis pv. poae TaxID=227946 RepID=A0A199P8T6_9XANT|nr:hypothetical protein A6R73_10150 [Xanthomonas translucens pv. poae]